MQIMREEPGSHVNGSGAGSASARVDFSSDEALGSSALASAVPGFIF